MKKQILVTTLLLGILLGGCSVDRNGSSSSDESEISQSSNVDESIVAEEPTEEELIELIDQAMEEINDLAFNDDTFEVLDNIFNGEIEYDSSNCLKIDGRTYEWTSRKYREVVDYYSRTFTDEFLDWLLPSRFADVDGVLYAFPGGGASGRHCTIVSVEKVEGNTYRACYRFRSDINKFSEAYTTFSIQKIDAGYRISGIDYRPDTLGLD